MSAELNSLLAISRSFTEPSTAGATKSLEAQLLRDWVESPSYLYLDGNPIKKGSVRKEEQPARFNELFQICQSYLSEIPDRRKILSCLQQGLFLLPASTEETLLSLGYSLTVGGEDSKEEKIFYFLREQNKVTTVAGCVLMAKILPINNPDKPIFVNRHVRIPDHTTGFASYSLEAADPTQKIPEEVQDAFSKLQLGYARNVLGEELFDQVCKSRDHFSLSKIDTVKDPVVKGVLRAILSVWIQKLEVLVVDKNKDLWISLLNQAIKNVLKLMNSEYALPQCMAKNRYSLTYQKIKEIGESKNIRSLEALNQEIENQAKRLDLQTSIAQISDNIDVMNLSKTNKKVFKKRCDNLLSWLRETSIKSPALSAIAQSMRAISIDLGAENLVPPRSLGAQICERIRQAMPRSFCKKTAIAPTAV